MAQDRVYINQCSLREKTFDNGGSLIKLLDLADNIKIHSENNDNGIYDAKIIQYKNALKQIRSK